MTEPRRTPAQAVLTVEDVEEISPDLIRVTAGGDGYDDFTDNPFTDKYVKVLFADPAHGLTPPYDLARLRATVDVDATNCFFVTDEDVFCHGQIWEKV